jgi:hypothetical protein
MLDGVVPDNNVYDNPSTWSPESDFLSDVEAAADAVVNGSNSGVLSFSRATGEIVEMEIEGPSDPPNVAVAVQGRSQSSVLLVMIAGFHFRPVNFAAMLRFLARFIYSALPALKYAEPHLVHQQDSFFSQEVDGLQLGSKLIFSFFFAKLFISLSGTLPEDLALRFELKMLLCPRKRAWAVALGGLRLDETGNLFWSDDSASEDSSASFAFAVSDSAQEGGEEVSSAAGARRRGRPRKVAAPEVESQVKRTLRSNNQGYNYEMLPYQPSRRKVSKVLPASTPAILQIEEMQRIGIEDCQIDPAALTVERLLKQREEKE